MSEYSVEHVHQRQGGSIVPTASYVYIRRVRPNAGGIFRVEVGAGGACGAASVLSENGSAWSPVAGRLSVDTGSEYITFWHRVSDAGNFPTQVLRFVMEDNSNSHYSFTPSAEDSRLRRISSNRYVPVTVRAIDIEGPFYYIPGGEQTATIGTTTERVNFWWKIRWETTATSGYLVQEITTPMDAQNCAGQPAPVSGSPRYWEAWQITGRNQFQPAGFDYWTIQTGLRSQGTWTKVGRVFWVPTLNPRWGFIRGQVTNAGTLMSSAVPAHDLGTPILTRQAGGRWDGCAAWAPQNIHVRQ